MAMELNSALFPARLHTRYLSVVGFAEHIRDALWRNEIFLTPNKALSVYSN
jgi:hypothetical protein